MDLITTEKLKEIITHQSDWCVSLFMPAHRAGRETEQNPIRFKNLLGEAEERLLAKEIHPSKVDEMLKKPLRLLQERLFWQHQSDGLVLYLSEDVFYMFRLPVGFEEMVVVTDRFHVKPLLPILTSGGVFHILAISQNQIRLLEGTQFTIDEVDLEETPETLADSFPDDWPKQKFQFQSMVSSGGAGQAGKPHAHATGSDIKLRLKKWFRIVDKEVTKLLADTQTPLVLAGVDSLFPLYKEVNTYPYLAQEGIPGNPDTMKPEDLHPLAWSILEPKFNKEREASIEKYKQLAGTGLITSDVVEAVLAAHHGRIKMLFVSLGTQVWGRFDPENEEVHLHESAQPKDEDLLDFIAIQTLLKGGSVWAVAPEEVPGQALVAAVLRF